MTAKASGRRLAIFGPLPPPHSGVETITQTLLSELERLGSRAGLRYRHVNAAVNRTQRAREAFQPRKLVLLLGQPARGGLLALRGYDGYYPISQNRVGLLRDMALLLPFRLTRRTVTIHLHGGALDRVLQEQPRWMRRLVHAVVGRPDAYGIVLTSSLRHCLEPLVNTHRIVVVPNTVPAPPLSNKLWISRKRFAFSSSAP